MNKKLFISIASAALIGVGGIAFAQAPAPQSQSGTEQSAPAARGGEGKSGGQMAPREGGTQMAPRQGASEQRAQDQSGGGMKSKGSAEMNDGKASQEKSASDNGMKGNRNAAESDSKANPKAAADTKSDSKMGTTTGQAGAGGKQLTSEQRTTVRTSITKLNVRPVTNVNFSISVGTRVPRGVEFHPLPVEVVNIYPDWRGYEFILVNDQILVVNPRTLEIVAVLEA